MNRFTALDNPIWNALATRHRYLARANGDAARYPTDVSPMAGVAEPTPRAFADLAELVEPGQSVAIFGREQPMVPAEWEVTRARGLEQMVQAEPGPAPAAQFPVAKLGPMDIPDMLALTALAQPGPFLPRTIEMGRYFGIRDETGRLAAMAGERLSLAEFTEISAVCTHPDFRGRGYGLALVAYVANKIRADGKTPFLHVVSENPAMSVYRKAGLTHRCTLALTIITRR